MAERQERGSMGGEREQRGSIGLIQRNREIAEVREEILQADQQLDACQTRNHVLLEETSVLDSNIYDQANRAAASESQLAQLVAQTRDCEEELATQQAIRARQASRLQGELEERSERLRKAESEASSRKEDLQSIDGEIAKLQALLETENSTIATVRRKRSETIEMPPQDIDSTVLKAVEDELQVLRGRQDQQQEEAAAARRDIERLESELASEQSRREDVSTTLRRAVVDQAEGSRRVRTAESSIAAKGGDAKAALARLRGTEGAPAPNPGAEKVEDLRRELRSVEEQCQNLAKALEGEKGQGSQAAERLNAQLDSARAELQTNIKKANDAHSSEVAKLEGEIQAERQRSTEEEVCQRISMDQIAQLKATRDRANDERGCAIVRTQAEAGRCAALEEELHRVQSEIRAVEARLAAVQARAREAEQRAVSAQDAGAQRVAMVRSKIEALWQSLRTARSATVPGALR